MGYEFFYSGKPYSLDPNYGELFTGYRIPFSELGLAVDPRTANQINEVATKMNPGGKILEVGAVQPDVFESIPKQHFKEINRLSKLTGVEITVHPPVTGMEPSGYNQQGWSEENRKGVERQMWDAVEKSHELSDKGNIPVTFHSSALLPEGEVRVLEEGKEVPKSMLAADTRTGEIIQIKETEKHFPEEIPKEYESRVKTEKFIPELELKKRNEETWFRSLNQLDWYAMHGKEKISMALNHFKEKTAEPEKAKIILEAYAQPDRDKIIEKLPEGLKENANQIFRMLDSGNIQLRDSYNMLKEYYNRVYKEAIPEDREKLDAFRNEIKKEVESGIEKNPEKLLQFASLVEKGVKTLKDTSPNLYIPLNDFLIDKSSDTFSNIALQAYKRFGDKAPVLAIENPPIGGALARGEELKKLIEESKKKFVKKAQSQGISESQAESIADKLIGATWDVGHINMLRKYGYGKEEIIKESEKIAPMLKKVHLSDNFGMEHTELPMGMGNVPIKEIMEKLGKEGFEAKKIVEAGNWWQHFSQQGKIPPTMATLEAFGSPLYSIKAPYWNQMPAMGNYFAMPSAYFPEQHFSIYGSGFSTLPHELGGQVPGKGARFSGQGTE